MPQRGRGGSTVDPHVMYRIAQAFWGVAQNAVESLDGCLPDCFEFPLGVNLALSLEIHLKCLITLERTRPSETHDLEKLFYRLSPETQERAERIYDEVRVTDAVCLREAELLRRRGWDPEDVFSLRAALRKSAHAFLRLRYAYEEPTVSDFTLSPLIIAINRIILERKPEWNPSRRNLSPPGSRPPTSPPH
jgi:hypothetical protein